MTYAFWPNVFHCQKLNDSIESISKSTSRKVASLFRSRQPFFSRQYLFSILIIVFCACVLDTKCFFFMKRTESPPGQRGKQSGSYIFL